MKNEREKDCSIEEELALTPSWIHCHSTHMQPSVDDGDGGWRCTISHCCKPELEANNENNLTSRETGNYVKY